MKKRTGYLRNSHPIPCVDCGRIVTIGAARIWRARGGTWLGAHADKTACPAPHAAAKTPENIEACGRAFAPAIVTGETWRDAVIDMAPAPSDADPLGIGY